MVGINVIFGAFFAVDGPAVSIGACCLDCPFGDPVPGDLAALLGDLCTIDKIIFFELTPPSCFGLFVALNFVGRPLFLPDVLVGGPTFSFSLVWFSVVVSAGPKRRSGGLLSILVSPSGG